MGQIRLRWRLNNPLDPITFQAILYADGRIRFNYIDLECFPHADSENTHIATGGISATVGIWSGTPGSITLPAGKFVPGSHWIDSESDTRNRGEVRDSYVRLAWDTGGAAWDIGVVDAFFANGGIQSNEANALRNTFIDSLASQIKRKHDVGDVYRSDQVLRAINFGGPATEGFEADFNPSAPHITFGSSIPIDVDSNSIPFVPASTTTNVVEVFRSARTPDQVGGDINITIDTLTGGQSLTDGNYIVELFFADIHPDDIFIDFQQIFDVVIEGKTYLNDYDIFNDFARIEFLGDPPSQNELDVARAGQISPFPGPAGIVKRFEVAVGGIGPDAGLQLQLKKEFGRANPVDPLLCGLRILRADPPRVENVVIKGSAWADGVDYSYADVVPTGSQLRPIPIQPFPIGTPGTSTIEIHFTGPVNVVAGDLTLQSTNGQIITTTYLPDYDEDPLTETWSVAGGLTRGKYAVKLNPASAGHRPLAAYRQIVSTPSGRV